MERIFLVIGHRVRTDAKFNLNDLCGSTGRLDILLRTINSAFLLSNGIRKDVTVYFVLKGEPNPPVAIVLKGDELKYLNPDERSTGALIRQALLVRRDGSEWKRSTPGIFVSNRGVEEVVEELKGEERVPVYLHETGTSVYEDGFKEIGTNVFFVLGDQYDLTDDEEATILGEGAGKIALGPNILHTDHCIILIHNALDRIKNDSKP